MGGLFLISEAPLYRSGADTWEVWTKVGALSHWRRHVLPCFRLRSVCVCESVREKERESVCVCMCERGRQTDEDTWEVWAKVGALSPTAFGIGPLDSALLTSTIASTVCPSHEGEGVSISIYLSIFIYTFTHI